MALAFPIVRSLSPLALVAAAGMLGSVASGQGVPCPQDCPPQVMKTICYEAGRVDSFAAPIDPLTPRPLFASFLSTYNTKPFDDATVNRVVGTSFQNLPCGIVGAVLEIKLRAENDLPYNDSISLQCLGSTFAWGSPISALPGAGGTWNAGQTQTFTINLGTLPGGIIGLMNATGALDVMLQDDTTVDYARLTIRVCPCDGPTRVYTVGTVDNLASPTEPTSRRPRLTALRTVAPFLWKDNDDNTLDRGWGHTFTGLPRGIIAADFTVRMKPSGSGSSNDGLGFDLLNQGAPEMFSRGFNINTLASPWVFGVNPLTNFHFDLGATLPTTVCGTNLLGDFGDGVFDVYIQDDTAIDAARLRVKPCPPMKRFWGLPYSVTGYARVDAAADGSITVVPASNGDGVSFDALGVDRQVFKLDPAAFAAAPEGTEMTIGVTGPDFDGDGYPDVVIGGTAVAQGGSVTKVKASSERHFLALAFHVRDVHTGEIVSGTLQGDQAITVMSRTLSSVEWNAEGDTIFAFGEECDMVLPDGRRVRGQSVDLDDRDFDANSVARCDWSWGLSQSGSSAPRGGGRILGVSSAINGVLHTQTGSEATMSTNPGSITLSDIVPGTQTGLELRAPGEHIPKAKGMGADIAVACAGLPENCDDSFAMTAACRGKRSEAQPSIDASRIRGSDGTSSGYALRAGNCCRGHVIIMKIYDDEGNQTGERVIPPGTTIQALTGGKLTKADAGYEKTADGEFPWVSVSFDQDVSFLGDSGTVPATGRRMLLQSTDPAAADDGFLGMDLAFSGVAEVDVSGQRAEFEDAGSPCPADFNQDGGIDGDDITAFFAAWENGDASADANRDGGVDGDDVTEFFRVWENGGC